MAGDITENNYFHLVALAVDVCPFVLREYFMKIAKEESEKQGQSYKDINTYLFQNQGQVLSLLTRKKIKQVQFDLIFQSGDIEKWDVTLLTALIKGLFNALPSSVKKCIDYISAERNEVAHKSLDDPISDDEFLCKLRQLEAEIKFMANEVNSESVKEKTENRIQNIKEVKMKGIVTRVMQQWTNLKVDEIREELRAVKADTKKANETLDDVTIETTESGKKRMRMRMLSTGLEKMQCAFQRFASNLESKDNSHLNPALVLEHLQTSKKVVISSYSRESRELLALKAIEKMQINQSKCCLMMSESEWDHVNPDLVKAVIVKDAFGWEEFQPERAHSMKAIAQFVNDLRDVVVIFLTDHGIYIDFKEEQRDNFPFEVVKILGRGTKGDPIEISDTFETSISDPVLRNMIDQTNCFISDCSNRRVDDRVLQKALKVMKEKKVVFIQSKDPQSRRFLAVRLLSDFKPRCVLLQSPEDLKHVALGQIIIVLIEDFTGKFEFDRQIYDNWYRAFDILMAAVREGKTRVITTIDMENIKNLEKLHPILCDREVVVESNDIIIKSEPLFSGRTAQSTEASTSSIYSKVTKQQTRLKNSSEEPKRDVNLPVAVILPCPAPSELDKVSKDQDNCPQESQKTSPFSMMTEVIKQRKHLQNSSAEPKRDVNLPIAVIPPYPAPSELDKVSKDQDNCPQESQKASPSSMMVEEGDSSSNENDDEQILEKMKQVPSVDVSCAVAAAHFATIQPTYQSVEEANKRA